MANRETIKSEIIDTLLLVLRAYVLIAIQADWTYLVASLHSWGAPVAFNRVYYISCVIAVLYLGKHWWLFPFLYWQALDAYIISFIGSYSRFGWKTVETEWRWLQATWYLYVIFFVVGILSRIMVKSIIRKIRSRRKRNENI